ncbi:RnfH family protein [Orrella sp. NBD-18]|uniref:UPF0125 protein G3I67_01560 n=1 Tax=Sheuella amnicola TaxID=2707330 RepID=A0A6B2QT86_9BURK|nr:RnfH family protein [Sheuella amnicola]NDY81906.1 RnfH family protein [Sheuella amnicola]
MTFKSSNLIQIRIVFCDQDSCWDRTMSYPDSITLGMAIVQSGFLNDYPGFSINDGKFGVFGSIKPLDTVMQDNDRIEIYRPLIYDPKTSRRRRAIHRQKARNIKKKVPISDRTQ